MNHSTIEILPVQTRAELKKFITLTEPLYRDDPNWVQPLLIERLEFFDRRKNPFFNHADVQLFLAYQEGKPVGRVSAHISHRHNEFHQEKTGFFGFFESIESYDVAESLLRTGVDWLAKRDMDWVRGPMNFTTNHEVGLLVDGFSLPPVFMMPYNPSYYAEFIERFGFQKSMDLYAYRTDDANPTPERYLKVAERVKKRSGCTFRTVDFGKFDDEIARIKEVYNGAWAHNWGFVPLTDEEFNFTAADMKKLADPALILIAEDQGRPVGFSMALPNLNEALIKLNGRLLPFGLFKLLWLTKIRPSIRGVRILTMGILPEYQKRGLDAVFYHDTFVNGTKRGYTWAESSWILEINEMMNRAAENLGYARYKTYRIYDLALK